jgi:hypothetical protein
LAPHRAAPCARAALFIRPGPDGLGEWGDTSMKLES